MDNITIINNNLQFVCQKVSQAEGFETPTTRDVFIDPPEREGSLFINELAGKREFSWHGLIMSDIQANRRLISRVCQPGGLKLIKFELCDGIQVQIEATVKLLSVYSKTRCTYVVSAKAPNPYFLSQILNSEMTGITVGRGGLPIPAAIPGPIGNGGGNPFVVTNNGDTYARPIFQIKGPGTNFFVENLDTGESFRLNLTLTSSEVVTIDTSTNDVSKGSQTVFGSVDRDPVGSWIRLQPGDNHIVFSAISGSDLTTKLTIEWRDTYAGF